MTRQRRLSEPDPPLPTAATLPFSPRLPVEHLVASLNDVTNSYKFYWLLALLEHIQETQSRYATLDDLVARMLAAVWYPSNYFRLSFGKQDRLSQITEWIRQDLALPVDLKKTKLLRTLQASLRQPTPLTVQMRSLADYVPYRFQRPFFVAALRGKPDQQVDRLICQMADHAYADPNAPCLYRYILGETAAIELQPEWFDYLQTHHSLVMGFCLWRLTGYLQRNNPNVPNIVGKLFAPEQRDLNAGRRYWQAALDSLGTVSCIYSGQPVGREGFSLDHFLPWRFVVHDLLWNIVPAPKSVNSAKSDALPDFAVYFEPFAQLQYRALHAVAQHNKPSLLEDYILLFRQPSVVEVQALSFDQFKGMLHDTLAPQIQIARNMGFSAGWRYRTA